MSLPNKNNLVVVTGGSRGIGRAIAECFLSKGFTVYFTYLHSKDKADEILATYPETCKAFQVDGSDPNTVSSFAKSILETGVPYILVNNIGINSDELFVNQKIEEFWRILTTNLGSTLNFCKAFLEAMMEKRCGNIVNISSIAAIKPKVGNSAYGVSKIAIERFSKSLALEVARFNIHVNCIALGFVKTDLFRNFIESKDERKFYLQIPMRKILTPQEVGDIVFNVCSGNFFTTGSVFYVGNGENIV